MKQHKQQRQKIFVWRVKLAAMIAQAFTMGEAHNDEEAEALQIAPLELAITGFLTREDQTGTMTLINRIMHDIFDADHDATHWRNREEEQIVEFLRQTHQEIASQNGRF